MRGVQYKSKGYRCNRYVCIMFKGRVAAAVAAAALLAVCRAASYQVAERVKYMELIMSHSERESRVRNRTGYMKKKRRVFHVPDRSARRNTAP